MESLGELQRMRKSQRQHLIPRNLNRKEHTYRYFKKVQLCRIILPGTTQEGKHTANIVFYRRSTLTIFLGSEQEHVVFTSRLNRNRRRVTTTLASKLGKRELTFSKWSRARENKIQNSILYILCWNTITRSDHFRLCVPNVVVSTGPVASSSTLLL